MAVVRLDENDVGRLWTGPFDQPRARGAGSRDRSAPEGQLVLRARPDEVADDGARDGRARAGGPRDLRDRPRAADDRGGDPASARGRDLGARRHAIRRRPVGWPGARRRRDRLRIGRRATSYLYRRQMNDGSEVMFAGPLVLARVTRAGAVSDRRRDRERVPGDRKRRPRQGNVVTWQQMGASGSDTDLLVNWDTANQRIISCPFARGTLPAAFSPGTTRMAGIVSPDRSRYAFADAGALGASDGIRYGPLVELSIAGAGSCALLAAKDVRDVVLADEAVAWIECARGRRHPDAVAGRRAGRCAARARQHDDPRSARSSSPPTRSRSSSAPTWPGSTCVTIP